MDVIQTNAFGPISVAIRRADKTEWGTGKPCPICRNDLAWHQSRNFGYESTMQAYVEQEAKKLNENVVWVQFYA